MQTIALSDQHIPKIVALARRIWPVAYAGILTPEQIENLLSAIYNEANLRAEFQAGHRFWGIDDGDHLAAFASAYTEDTIIWLRKLYVLPEHQGKGLGKRLMQHAANAFSSATQMQLLVNQHNTAAQHFYSRCGFVKTNEVPVKMGDFHFTDWVMTVPLASLR